LCALAGAAGEKLSAPIAIRDSGRRDWSEPAVRDCFDDPKGRRTSTVTLLACTRSHTAQVTHTFSLPRGRRPGEPSVVKKAEQGCTARQDAYFRKHPSPVPLQAWHVYPTQETWGLGDREVICYVTARNERPLQHSVMSR
jgi:hypothetical protein